jgi:DNA-binding transcriptional LysR family regulator
LRQQKFHSCCTNIGKSQSTLSRDVIQLEKKIGFKVFERNIRGIELTEQGKKLLMIANEFNFKLDKI